MLKNIVIAGGGISGSQIAFQCAYKGFQVTIWLRSSNFFEETQAKLHVLRENYADMISAMSSAEGRQSYSWAPGIADYDTFNEADCFIRTEAAETKIRLETDLKKALENADLLIDATPENFEAKYTFFEMAAPLIQEKTIVATGSTSVLPSRYLKAVKHEERFLGLHFPNMMMKNNIGEIMVLSGTTNQTYTSILEFVRALGMIPLSVRKENKGFLLNAMLIPTLISALDMYTKGISDIESIDKAWTVGLRCAKGPFELIDAMGLPSLYEIICSYGKLPSFLTKYNYHAMAEVLKQYIESGKLGKSSGEGFYKYQ